MTESCTVCQALAFGSRRFQECYIVLISVIQHFDVRKGHVHLHKRITKTAQYDADIQIARAAREIRNAYILVRIPEVTGPFGLNGCRWENQPFKA
jgi:hypothetical protein